MRKAFYKSTEHLALALLEKMKFGKKSSYLTKLSLQEIKKLKGEELIRLFREVQKVECNFYYCGTLDKDKVTAVVLNELPVDRISKKSKAPVYRETAVYNEPTVFLYHMPDASQSIVYGYVKEEALPEEEERFASRLFSGYFGGDMSSLMFQEIREFRSFAYRTSARYKQLPLVHKDKPSELTTLLSTQSDKTIDALTVLDSLIRKMLLKPERIPAVKQTIVNNAVNNYPSFRRIPEKVASLLDDGYTEDPNKKLIEYMQRMEMEDVVRFYDKNISCRPVVYVIVGNTKKIDLNKLASFGKIVKVKKDQIYR